MPSHEPLEGGAVNPERPGGAADVAAVLGQGPLKELSFHPGDDLRFPPAEAFMALPLSTSRPISRGHWEGTVVQAALLDGDAPRSNPRGRQRRRVEDQRETLRRGRHREEHSRQGQGPVAHVHCGGAAEGDAPAS